MKPRNEALYRTVVANFMRLTITILILFGFTLGYSQEQDIRRLKLKHFEETEYLIKLSRLCQKLNMKEGEIIRIACAFELNEDGTLDSVTVAAPRMEFVQLTKDHWKSLDFPNENIDRDLDYNNILFSVAIIYNVLSNTEINRLVRKKRRLEDKKSKRKN